MEETLGLNRVAHLGTASGGPPSVSAIPKPNEIGSREQALHRIECYPCQDDPRTVPKKPSPAMHKREALGQQSAVIITSQQKSTMSAPDTMETERWAAHWADACPELAAWASMCAEQQNPNGCVRPVLIPRNSNSACAQTSVLGKRPTSINESAVPDSR